MRNKWFWSAILVLPLSIGGIIYAGVQNKTAVQKNVEFQNDVSGYVCPVTGEELPCPKCCPFNK